MSTTLAAAAIVATTVHGGNNGSDFDRACPHDMFATQAQFQKCSDDFYTGEAFIVGIFIIVMIAIWYSLMDDK